MHMAPIESAQHWPVRRATRTAGLVVCLALLAALTGGTQNASPQNRTGLPPPLSPGLSDGIDDFPNGNSMEQEKMLRALNADRQKSMVADTNRLLRLVNELNAEIARNKPDALTSAQLHKVEEIEKLARSVREKMSTSVRGTPAFQPPFQPVRH